MTRRRLSIAGQILLVVAAVVALVLLVQPADVQDTYVPSDTVPTTTTWTTTTVWVAPPDPTVTV
jgi:cytochrome c-type biogenesis protein CcmE